MYQPIFIYIYIIPSILISPILSISINSWFLIWITLEFNLITFIPIIIFFNKYYKNIALKYFIIQAFSSSILILCSNSQIINFFELNNFINLLLNISILIKLGAAPFHNWFINLINNINWINCLILSTWQKIIPIILIIYSFNYKLIYFSIIFSCLIGSIIGLNHQSLRLIIRYSSINHIRWILLNIIIRENLWILYFFSYFFINISIILIFNEFNIYFLNQIYKLNNKINKYIILINFISIRGLPPIFGFIIKWFSLFLLNFNNNFIIIIILIMISILNFFFYIRICIIILIQFNFNLKSIIKFKLLYNKNNLNYFIFINSFLYIWLINIWLN